MDTNAFWALVARTRAHAQLRDARGWANRWDLWAAAHLALGGASDDSFLDFRNWLISHGRETYERASADPASIADLAWDDEEEDFGRPRSGLTHRWRTRRSAASTSTPTSPTRSASPSASRSRRTTTRGPPPGSRGSGRSTARPDLLGQLRAQWAR